MDWDLKAHTCKFAETETIGEFERKPMLSTAGMASSGSSKRPRPHGFQIASCLVDGCVSDLSKCREYHRRHKVCEAHSKTAVVMVGGREQRFCQQCSRFHLLAEFDEAKRSCRKRLDGHNRRRRKPHPDTISPGTFTNHQGNRLASYGGVLPTTAPRSERPTFIETKDERLLYGHHFPLSSRGSYQEPKQFPFLLKSSASAAAPSDCALSLLSAPVGQPLVADAHYAAISCSGMDDNNGHDDFDSNAMFRVGIERSPDGGNSQTLPFIWE